METVWHDDFGIKQEEPLKAIKKFEQTNKFLVTSFEGDLLKIKMEKPSAFKLLNKKLNKELNKKLIRASQDFTFNYQLPGDLRAKTAVVDQTLTKDQTSI